MMDKEHERWNCTICSELYPPKEFIVNKETNQIICKNCVAKRKEIQGELMAKQYGWIAKDKYGVFWFGTLGKKKEDSETNFNSKQKDEHELKLVKVKLVEVK